jgi:hypothetical protein
MLALLTRARGNEHHILGILRSVAFPLKKLN